MSIESEFRTLRETRLNNLGKAVPDFFQNIDKKRIHDVLVRIDRETTDMIDVVFALLDNQTPSQFSATPSGTKFSDGATVAHIGAHVGILQRGDINKLDREGRDYWIKPLAELGAIELIYFDTKTRKFLPGHPVAKSPNSAYRISKEFVEILKDKSGIWEVQLDEWIKEENIRQRVSLQAEAQKRTSVVVDSSHSELINLCQDIYIPQFLPDYVILFVDSEDGERITPDEKQSLSKAGIDLTPGDAMPDILLWNPENDALWVIEAVTSDGEVDSHKVNQMLKFCREYGKSSVGFTTVYASWRDTARRQAKHRNIAPGTYIWIGEDPSKHFRIVEMQDEIKARGLRPDNN